MRVFTFQSTFAHTPWFLPAEPVLSRGTRVFADHHPGKPVPFSSFLCGSFPFESSNDGHSIKINNIQLIQSLGEKRSLGQKTIFLNNPFKWKLQTLTEVAHSRVPPLSPAPPRPQRVTQSPSLACLFTSVCLSTDTSLLSACPLTLLLIFKLIQKSTTLVQMHMCRMISKSSLTSFNIIYEKNFKILSSGFLNSGVRDRDLSHPAADQRPDALLPPEGPSAWASTPLSTSARATF